MPILVQARSGASGRLRLLEAQPNSHPLEESYSDAPGRDQPHRVRDKVKEEHTPASERQLVLGSIERPFDDYHQRHDGQRLPVSSYTSPEATEATSPHATVRPFWYH